MIQRRNIVGYGMVTKAKFVRVTNAVRSRPYPTENALERNQLERIIFENRCAFIRKFLSFML